MRKWGLASTTTPSSLYSRILIKCTTSACARSAPVTRGRCWAWTHTRRCILGVFAHPDDETSCAGGTFWRYVHAGVDIYVATATRGGLGSHGQVVTREGLPRVREAELRTVLQMYGAKPPIFLGYRDQEVLSTWT